MEVTTAADEAVSVKKGAAYVAVTVVFVVVSLGPALFSMSYVKALKTAILVIVFSQIARLLVSSVVSIPDPKSPPALEDESALPSVSVLIPAYDEANVLPETLDACRGLDYPTEKLEVVVCYETDCNDRTGEIAEAAAAEDDRFVALERDEPGGGKAKAVNYALDAVSSDVITIIDADHRFESNALRRAARWFQDDDVMCVKGRCYGRNPTDSMLSLHATVERHILERSDIFARQRLGAFTFFGGSCGFFRNDVFEDVGAFDDDMLLEDIDISARIHEAGHELRVDPEIVTTEEHPATFSAWWAQRKRWARGWLQVGVRHLPLVARSSNMSWRARLDGVYTFAYPLILPFLIVGIPLPVLDLAYFPHVFSTVPTAHLPHSRPLWTILGAFPPLGAICTFFADYRAGRAHHPWEYAAILTVGAYLFIQTFVYIVAFIDEFVFRTPATWVTTTRVDS